MKSRQYNIWNALEMAIRLATRAHEEVRILAGRAPVVGPEGPPGAPGAPGRLPKVELWSKGVHYDGTVVAHEGATWQARCDTAEEPPHRDWLLLAAAGRDAPVGTVHGLYEPGLPYRAFDLVVWNGSEWRAKRDDPGSLPGDGWALSAQIGKTGKPGPTGPIGPPGKSAPLIIGWTREGYAAIPLLSDGSVGPPLDLLPFFEAYHSDAGL